MKHGYFRMKILCLYCRTWIISPSRHCEERSDDAISKASAMRFRFYALAEARRAQSFARSRTRIKRMKRIDTDFLVMNSIGKVSGFPRPRLQNIPLIRSIPSKTAFFDGINKIYRIGLLEQSRQKRYNQQSMGNNDKNLTEAQSAYQQA